MAQLWWNFGEGTTDTLLAVSGTTLSGSFLSAMPEVTGGDYVVLVLDPEAAGNGPEVVHVTAHTASATTATITRAQESTSDVQHASGTKVVAPVTKAALDAIISAVASNTTHSGLATGNPHNVTAAQAGAVPASGGTFSGHVTLAEDKYLALTGDSAGGGDGALQLLNSAGVAHQWIFQFGGRTADGTRGKLNISGNSTDVLDLVMKDGVILAQGGGVSLPGYTFNDWPTTGIIANATSIGLVEGGVERLRVDDGGNLSISGTYMTFGGIGANEYLLFDENSLRVYEDASEKLRIDASGNLHISGTRIYVDLIAGDNYIQFSDSSNIWGLWTAGVERFRADGTGDIHQSGDAHYFGGMANNHYIRGATSNQWQFVIGGVQELTLGVTGIIIPNVYSNDYAASANVYVHTDGVIYRATSSARYKDNIVPWSGSPILNLDPVSFDASFGVWETDEDGAAVLDARGKRIKKRIPSGRRHVGLIAEDVHAVFPEAVIYDEDGQPDALDWNAITTAIVGAVKDHEARIAALETA